MAIEYIGRGGSDGVSLAQLTTQKAGMHGTVAVQSSAPTTELTDLTQAGTFTPDYAIQAITNSSPYGFANAAEGETVVSVVQANKVRIAEIITCLQAHGLMAS